MIQGYYSSLDDLVFLWSLKIYHFTGNLLYHSLRRQLYKSKSWSWKCCRKIRRAQLQNLEIFSAQVDMRVLTFDVPPQEVKFIMGMFSTFTSLSFLPLQILTKDSVTVFVDAIMYYKVVLMFGRQIKLLWPTCPICLAYLHTN